jgi:hypothetical protein
VANSNPRSTLTIVLCGSLIVYVAVSIILLPYITPTIIIRDDLVIAILQGAFVYLILLLAFLLPTSYVYWSHRIHVKVLGPEVAAAEPGEDLKLTVAVDFPRHQLPKNAVLEAFLGNLNITTQKLESSPTELRLQIPQVDSGYHKITIRVSQEGYFRGMSSYELLIAKSDDHEEVEKVARLNF